MRIIISKQENLFLVNEKDLINMLEHMIKDVVKVLEKDKSLMYHFQQNIKREISIDNKEIIINNAIGNSMKKMFVEVK